MKWIYKIVTLLFFSCQGIIGNAMPISPMSLPLLIDQSDIVALVRVDSIDRWETSDDGMTISSSDLATAFLSVSKVYKGKLRTKKLELGYMANMTCPTPPNFNKSDRTIVFLSEDSATGNYSVLWLSYGTKVMNDNQKLKAYEGAITTFMNLGFPNNEQEIRNWHQWIKDCANSNYLINEIDIFFQSMSQSKKLIKQMRKEYKKYDFDKELLNMMLRRSINEVNDLAIINFLSKQNYFPIKKKLVSTLKANPYNGYLNYFIMLKLISFQRNKKKAEKIADEYYSSENSILDESLLLDDEEELRTSKEEIKIIHRRMDLQLKNFISSLN